MAAWDKRLRSPSLRAIAQNQALGVFYYRLEALHMLIDMDVEAQPLYDAIDVLEELANRGRCIVALPDESRLALYFVESDIGTSRLVWYEPCRRLASPIGESWRVSLDDDPSISVSASNTRRREVRAGVN
jgi:hypothetical protein